MNFKHVWLLVTYLSICSVFGSEVTEVVRVNRDNTGKPIPKYSNGYLLFYDHDGTITSYTATGVLATQVKAALPDTSRLLVRDVCAWADGAIGVAISAMQTEQGAAASVIIKISPTGQVERATRTTPFGVSGVVCAPNGRLWAAGREHDASYRDVPVHNVLREYDSEGRLLQSTLSTSSFAIANQHPVGSLFLVANDHSFGLYSGTANEFVQLDWSGTVTSRSITPPIARSSAVVISAALTPADELYLGGVAKAKGGQTVTMRWDRTANTFQPVSIPELAGDDVRTMNVLGAAGSQLIFYAKPSGMIRVSVP